MVPRAEVHLLSNVDPRTYTIAVQELKGFETMALVEYENQTDLLAEILPDGLLSAVEIALRPCSRPLRAARAAQLERD